MGPLLGGAAAVLGVFVQWIVVALVGGGEERGALFEMELDMAAQTDGAGGEGSGGDDDASAAGGSGRVEGALDGAGIGVGRGFVMRKSDMVRCLLWGQSRTMAAPMRPKGVRM